MRINQRILQAKRRNQRFNRIKTRERKSNLSFQRRRILLKEHWLRIRRRVDRWLSKALGVNPPDLQKEIYVVKDREIRHRETRISER